MKLRVLRRLTELALTIPEMWAKMIQHRFSTSRDPDPWGSAFMLHSWACGAAGSALPWHGRGRRFDPDQVHQISQWFSSHRHFDPEVLQARRLVFPMATSVLRTEITEAV